MDNFFDQLVFLSYLFLQFLIVLFFLLFPLLIYLVFKDPMVFFAFIVSVPISIIVAKAIF